MAETSQTNGQKDGAVGTTTSTEADGSANAFPPFNTETFAPQLIWLGLTFVALYYLMSRIALPRISGVISERAERIQRDIDEAEKLQTETETAIADYERALSEARGRASTIAKDTREKLQAETDRERADVDQQVADKIADAEQRIATAKTAALGEVNDIAQDAAGDIVGKLLGERPQSDEVAAAVAQRQAD